MIIEKVLCSINIYLIKMAVIYKNSLLSILNLKLKYTKAYKQIIKYLIIIKRFIGLTIKKIKIFKRNTLKYLI